MRSDRRGTGGRGRQSRFNPRSCTRSDAGMRMTLWDVCCFNPRSCTRSDREIARAIEYRFVSIHAPARGATAGLQQNDLGPDVSIHAPARGATAHQDLRQRVCRVSIHAPARGATASSDTRRPGGSFNPRSCTRSDANMIWWDRPMFEFQSTLPHEERLTIVVTYGLICCFNPRSRTRSDP